MGAVAVTLVGFFAFIILRLSAPTMVPLYTDLPFEDSAAIVSELESRNIPYELRRDGSLIMVPDVDALRLRMDLAGEGLPSGGGIGYEIFDRSDGLGTTSFVQNINHMRALEGELSRTIRALSQVTAARVHLAIPERQLFSRERVEPSASIALKSRGDLGAAQIRAIQHLVATAVEGLSPGRVSVVDESGRLLADGRGDDTPGSSHALDERRQSIERQLRNQIEDILASVIGRDRVRVQVAAELDFNRVTQTSDIYDPDSRVVRSTQTREESANASEANNDAVTVGTELPDAAGVGNTGGSQEESSSFEELINYEISRTTKTEVIEAGRIRRLSVAVVIDGAYSQSPDGDVLYEPRSQDELDRIAALVRSAIGYDEARGDSVEVANLRFAEAPQPISLAEPESLMPTLTRSDVLRLAELGVLSVLALLVLLFVARPLVKRILSKDEVKPDRPQLEDHSADGEIVGPDNVPQIAAPAYSEAIEMAQVAGEVQASSLKRVGELIDQNPSEAVSIIRNWIHEPAT
jgi:flagellar M-ring protein FliF